MHQRNNAVLYRPYLLPTVLRRFGSRHNAWLPSELVALASFRFNIKSSRRRHYSYFPQYGRRYTRAGSVSWPNKVFTGGSTWKSWPPDAALRFLPKPSSLQVCHPQLTKPPSLNTIALEKPGDWQQLAVRETKMRLHYLKLQAAHVCHDSSTVLSKYKTAYGRPACLQTGRVRAANEWNSYFPNIRLFSFVMKNKFKQNLNIHVRMTFHTFKQYNILQPNV